MRRAGLAAGALITVLIAGCGDNLEPVDTPQPSAFEPADPVMPRLTAAQYRNSLIDVFGEALPPTSLPSDTNLYLFSSIGASTETLSDIGAQLYADAAADVSDWVFADAERLGRFIDCTPSTPGDGCIRDSIAGLGLRLFRRPLTGEELERWVAVAVDTADSDPYQGARHALYGMLQAPSFLYRVELGEPDPDDPDRRRYTSYEMAQRISFLLWNTSPDAQLLAAAGAGAVVTDAGIYDQARRLLDSPRARAAVQSFFAEYFDLAALDQVERDVGRYPRYTDTLAASMRTEVQLLVDDHVFRRDADLRELLTTRRTFVNAELAALYGIEAPGATQVAFVPVELPEDGPRAGILTLGAFLTMNAHPTETSPTRRGKYLRERVLCQAVPPPPADVNLDLEPGGAGGNTLRDRLEQHRRDPACSGCHSFMDPPGFLFEGFDPVGAVRTQEPNGEAIDSSGDLDGIPLEDARDLAEMLRTDDRVAACVVEQLYRHASARLDQPGEATILADLGAAFAASGYRFQDLLIELVLSPGFRVVADQEVAP